MKRILPLIALFALAPVWAAAQTSGEAKSGSEVSTQQDSGLVTISSKGKDVRDVLFDLFTQAKKSFVLDPNVRYMLYLSLNDVEFDEALAIILDLSGLESETQNGIIYMKKKAVAKPNPNPQPEKKPAPATPKPLGKLTDDELQKMLTTRFSLTDMRSVFQEFEKQTGIKIEVKENVPAYKIDAFLINTSLKYALDVVTTAAGLKWSKTDNKTILIELKPKA